MNLLNDLVKYASERREEEKTASLLSGLFGRQNRRSFEQRARREVLDNHIARALGSNNSVPNKPSNISYKQTKLSTK